MKIIHKDIIALVVKDDMLDGMCCVTEYAKDGTWYLGLSVITSAEDVLKTARDNKLNIFFESRFK